MADESDVAMGVMKIAAQHNNICTFKRAYQEIPNCVKLNKANLAPSTTRPGELMWQQLVRNIKSHDKSPGNYIHDGFLTHVPRVGYRITSLGLKKLCGN